MKNNITKKFSKATIFLTIFVALTMVFTIYQTSINNSLNEALDGTSLSFIEDTPDVALAGTKTYTINPTGVGTYSFRDAMASQSLLDVHNSTDTTHTSANATYTSSKWAFGNNDWHTGNDFAIASLQIDLGDRIGRLCSKGLVTYTFEGHLDKNVANEVGFSVSSSSSSIACKSGNDMWETGCKKGSNTVAISGYWKSAPGESVDFSGKTLAGRYIRVYLGMYSGTGRFGSCVLTIRKFEITISGDSTKPSISGSEWQTGNTSTVTDTGSGIHSIDVKQYDLNGSNEQTLSSTYNASFTASGNSTTDSRTITFPNEGKYVFTVYDNVGNSNTKTIWYYNSKTTVKSSNNDHGEIAGSGSSSTSANLTSWNNDGTTDFHNDSTSWNGLMPGNYYVLAAAEPGYYFSGWGLTSSYTSDTNTTPGVGTYVGQSSNHYIWQQTFTISNPPKYNKFEWTANFVAIKSKLSPHKDSETESRFIPDYNGSLGSYPYDGGQVGITCSLSNVTIMYEGINGTTYTESPTAPVFAGNYRVKVWIKGGTNNAYTLGYTQFTFSITPIDLYVRPVIADRDYDGTATATCTGWTYDSINASGTSTYTTASGDSLSFATVSGTTFTFTAGKAVAWNSDHTAGIAKNITMTAPDGVNINNCVTMSTTKSGLDDTQKAQLIASYNLKSTFNTSSGGKDIVTATIKPITLHISLASTAYNDMKLATPFYIGGAIQTTGNHYGKQYDGTTSATFYGLTFSGLVKGDSINYKSEGADRTDDYKSASGEDFTLNGTILADFQGSATSISSNMDSLWQIKTKTISLGGDDYKNYTLSIAKSTQSSSNFQITTDADFLITQIPLEVEIVASSTPSKVYDGTTALQINQASYGFKDSSKIVAISNLVSVNFASGATLSFDDASANYHEVTNDFFGNSKTITLKGFALSGNDSKYYYLLNDSDTLVGNFQIKTCPITATVTGDNKVYDGNTIMVSNLSHTQKLANGTAFSVGYSEISFTNKNVGTYTAQTTITLYDDNKNYHLVGDGEFDNEITQDVTASITQKSIKDIAYSLNETEYNYTANAQYSIPTLTYTGVETLQENTHYTYEYYKDNADSEQNKVNAENIKNVGTYCVKVTAVNTSNYKDSIVLTFSIAQSEIVVDVPSTASISITFGDSYYTPVGGKFTSSELNNITAYNVNNASDKLTGSWSYVDTPTAIPNVGTYTLEITFNITSGGLENYKISEGQTQLVPKQTITLTVGKKAVTIVANAQQMTYGDNPTNIFKTTEISLKEGSSLVGTDTLSIFGGVECAVTGLGYPTSQSDITTTNIANYVMATTYPITFVKDFKTGANNYEVTLEDGTFTVNKRDVAFTAISLSKVYGEDDPDIKNSFITTNMSVEDTQYVQLFLYGYLKRNAGENVGTYDYTAETIRPNTDGVQDLLATDESKVKYFNLINYNFTTFALTTDSEGKRISFNITKKLISIEIASDEESVFGDAINLSQSNYVVNGLVSGDIFSVIFPTLYIERTNANGNVVTATSAGTYYLYVYEKIDDLNKTPLSVNENEPNKNLSSNYDIYFKISETKAKYVISKRDVIVTPKTKTKTYGYADPDLTDYTIENYASGETLLGSFQREVGENVGSYAINQGTFGVDAQNYNVIFNNPDDSIKLTITKLEVVITPVETAHNRVTYNEDIASLQLAISQKANMLTGYFKVEHEDITNKANGAILSDNDALRSLITQNGGGIELPNFSSIDSVGAYEMALNSNLTNVDEGSPLANYTFVYESLGLQIVVNGSTKTGSFLVEPFKAKIVPIKPQNITYGEQPDVATFTFRAEDPNDSNPETNGIDPSNFSGTLGLMRQGYDGLLPVGNYAITIGTLSSENYAISLDTTPVYLTVDKKEVLVTLSDSLIKVEYGEEEPVIAHKDSAKSSYTFSLTGLVDDSDNASYYYSNGQVALSRTEANLSAVDTYSITIGNLNTANPNYNCVLDGEYKLQITQRNLLVVPDVGYTAIYGSGEYTLGALTQQPTFKLFYKDDAQKPALIGSDEIGGTLKPIFVDGEGNHLNSLEASVGKYAYDKPDNYTGDSANYALTFYSDFANSIVADFDLTSLFSATSYTEDQQKIVDAFSAYGVDITAVYLEITPREIEVKFASSLSFNFGEEVTTENANVVYDAMNNDVLSLVYTLPNGLTVDGYGYPVYLPEEYDISIDVTESNKLNPNYIISFVENDYNFFEVNKIEISLKPVDGQGKVYLENNPTEYLFTTTGNYAEGFEPKDGDIALAREEGETPGDYSYYFIINEESEIFSDVYLYDCYDFITNESGYAFHISKAQASIKIGEEIIAVEDGKNLEIEYVYKNGAHTLTPALLLGGKDINGNDIATLRVDYLGLEQGIVENGTINVTAVGTYNFYIGIMASDIQMFNGCFISTYANLTVKVVPYSLGTLNPIDFGLTLQKIYGEQDPSFHFEITSELGDKLKGELVREEGEEAGTYLMTPGKVTNEDGSECDDYTFSVLTCYFEIAKRDITIAPSENLMNATKVYGDAELPIYEEIIAPVTNEALVATFTREIGENVGSYDLISVEINSTNYVVTLDAESANDVFTITKKKATVIAEGITKTFNAEKVENSSLTYKVEGVLEGDTLQGSLSIDGGEPTVVGTYKIVEEGFTFSGEGTDLNPNYDVAYVSAYVVINQAEVTVLPNSETYEYGDAIAPFTYTIKGTVYDGYPIVVVFNPLSDTGRGVHNITINRAEMTALNPNYLISVANATVTITVRRITITSTASVTQVYGDDVTEIPYEITFGSLLGEDKLSGALAPNDYVVGIHGVNQGTLSNPNYEITYVLDDASYEVTKRTVEVTAIATGSVYGDELASLEYTEVGLVNGDTLSGELSVNVLNKVGDYDIEVGTLAHPYYNVSFTKAIYTVTAREITLTIRDAESQYGEELRELSYYLSKGSILEGDELNVVLTKNGGTQMGQYEITGSYNNDNYSVTFVNGTYTIHKYQATITVETKYISFIEDGDARSIVASCDSGAEITFIVKGEEVTNYFREAGKYVVELSAEETDNYYAPEKVTVYVTINRPTLSIEANGIDVTLTTENGFDPNLTVEMEKLPVDYMDMVAELTSKQKIVRAFTLTSIDESGVMEEVIGKTTIRIKVPTALAEQSEVQVMVRENGTYNIINVDNVDGYVTLEVEALSSFAFIMEENTNYLLLILVGVGALIILGSVMVFLFRKRA